MKFWIEGHRIHYLGSAANLAQLNQSSAKIVDSTLFNLVLHLKYILNLWSMLYYPAEVFLKGFVIVFEIQ